MGIGSIISVQQRHSKTELIEHYEQRYHARRIGRRSRRMFLDTAAANWLIDHYLGRS